MRTVKGDYGQRRAKPGKRATFPVCKTITLTEGQAAKVQQLADAEGVTFSAIMRQLVDQEAAR